MILRNQTPEHRAVRYLANNAASFRKLAREVMAGWRPYEERHRLASQYMRMHDCFVQAAKDVANILLK